MKKKRPAKNLVAAKTKNAVINVPAPALRKTNAATNAKPEKRNPAARKIPLPVTRKKKEKPAARKTQKKALPCTLVLCIKTSPLTNQENVPSVEWI